MEKQKSKIAEQPQRVGKIKARVIDEQYGLQELEGVLAVRIIGKDNVLLILEDYASTLGRVDGAVMFLHPKGEVAMNNIRGFYKHQHNEFTLLIEEDSDGRYDKICL